MPSDLRMWSNTVVRSGSRSNSLLFKNEKIEWYLIAAISAAVALFLFYLFTVSEGLSGGMDSYNHYLISRYSFDHPELFLHYWGKPVYNIVAAPFTQFGIKGSVILNILSLIGSAILVYLSARELKIRLAFMAFVFVLFSPIFLDNTISSLTEPLNALLLALVIFLLSLKKHQAAALLTGFLPYARSEGFILAAVIGLYLLIQLKDWKIILYLLIGSLFFDVLGWIIESKPFWVITENPYLKFELSGENVCGSGSLFNYVRWGHVTFGAVSCLLIAASFYFSFKKYRTEKIGILSILLPALFISYFGIHSLIWALGMMGSCGYIRVMVVIVPITAILSAFALQQLIILLRPKIHNILLIFICLTAVIEPVKYYKYKYPIAVSDEQRLYIELNHWLQDTKYKDRTLVYMYPYLSMIANIDPWDRLQHEELWASSLPFYKKGDIILWDGHFGPNEADIPLNQLQNDPNYRFIKAFKPSQHLETLNGFAFEIYVFEKL